MQNSRDQISNGTNDILYHIQDPHFREEMNNKFINVFVACEFSVGVIYMRVSSAEQHVDESQLTIVKG